MSEILIRNALLLATMNASGDELTGMDILVKDGLISAVQPDIQENPEYTIINAENCVVLPGFINTHHHLYQTLTRNIPLMQNQPLFSWLTNHYEVWRELTEEAVSVSTTTGLLELMRSGVTTSSDHLYLFPEKTSSNLIDTEIQSARDLGIRFQPTRGSMSLGRSQGGLPPDDVVQTEAKIQADTERLVKKYHDPSHGAMVRISLAPCSPFSVTEKLMRDTVVYARDNDLMIHTHLAETLDEESFCLDKMGLRPVAFMKSLGWLSSNSWYAHMVHLNDLEIMEMGAIGAGVSHCPSSNMRLGSGIARIREMLDAGMKVSLGVDGSASNDSGNMLSEIRNAMLISRLRDQQYWLTARDVLKMATKGGAQVLGRDDIGEISVGKRADLALFSLEGIEYAGGMSDPLAALVFSQRTSPVDFLIVDGKMIIAGGTAGVDEEKLIREQNRISFDMLEKAHKKTGINFLNHGSI